MWGAEHTVLASRPRHLGASVAAVLRAVLSSAAAARPQKSVPAAATAAAALLLALKLFWHTWRLVGRRPARPGKLPWLQLTSPLPGSLLKLQRPHPAHDARPEGRAAAGSCPECWKGFCPCCKRPLEARLVQQGPPRREEASADVKGRYAFVITLWGSSREYVLGALVLGHSIKQTGTRHQLVCLHTDDVPQGFLGLLAKVWDCRLVEHVHATAALSWAEQDARFEKVFTKLRGLGLVEFEKVLMMDIDLLVVANIDDLFQLPAPAALKRGMNDNYWRYKHGDPIDGRSFFSGANPGVAHSWGQGTGINAGVMLWQPSAAVLQAMLGELAEPHHPGHCRGNGPEQDYLSRYWADVPWTNIAVEYNFQLHQMFNALHPNAIWTAERITCIDDPSRIRVVHFSGEPTAKPWHRVLDVKHSKMWPDRSQDQAYLDIFLKEFHGYFLWILRDKAAWDKVEELRHWGGSMSHLYRGDDGLLYQTKEPSGSSSGKAGGSKLVPLQLPEATLQNAVKALQHCLGAWFDTFSSLEKSFDDNLLAALAAAAPVLGNARAEGTAPTTWKTTWFAKLPTPTRTGMNRNALSGALRRSQWHRDAGGWYHEQARQTLGVPAAKLAKASVACGGCAGASFVVFSWAEEGCDSYFSADGEEVSGVFVKVLGRGASRCFSLADGDLSPLQMWVDGVSAGAVMLLAVVGLEAGLLAEALAVLAPLGAPPGPVRSECCALAAVGLTESSAPWDASHASCSAAYASVLVAHDEGGQAAA